MGTPIAGSHRDSYRSSVMEGESSTILRPVGTGEMQRGAFWMAGIASIVGLLLVLLALPSSSQGADRDCSDFSSQAAAQRYYDDHGPGDPSGLDSDGDGVACESNPCPCAKPGSGGGGGQPGGGGGGGAPKPPDLTDRARVISVTDGDTIKVRLDGRTQDVRLIGIDTPEVYFGRECGGKQASRSMHALLDPGNRVKLIRDPSQDRRDRYGRLLRYVERRSHDVGRKQLSRGWAQVYVFDKPFKRVRSYRRHRDRARRHDRGVWKRCDGDFHRPI